MNDSEIMSALWYCNGGDCEDCKALGKCHADWTFLRDAHHLINRQKAEIEKLKDYKELYEDLKAENLETIKKLKTAKSEAIKKFVERLKREIDMISYETGFEYQETIEAIDRLVEEMGGITELKMYKTPIELVMSKTKTSLEDMIYSHIQEMEILVDKDELIKALQYDRGQYDKGYNDGYKDAVREFAKRLKNEKHILLPPTGYDIDENDWVIYEDDIDQVVEEMEGNK